MTVRQIIERVQRQYPDVSMEEIVSDINTACERLGLQISKTEYVFVTTVADQRYYDLTSDFSDNETNAVRVLKVREVYYDGSIIDKLLAPPSEVDTS